ncbi:hypothetical protein [Paracoccus sp. (in: a-proteobacteria)]|uniref:hypothetical protein n=1 Tax=Paracoccus sp. TaxID=267 RepID=UPI003A887842
MTPDQLQHAISPALTGYGFQQTALIGMLPVLAPHLGLGADRIGLAIGAGLVLSAVAAPLLAQAMTQRRLRGALLLQCAASLALVLLLLWPPPNGMTFGVLLAIRGVQGTAAAVILAVAQGASAGSGRPVAALARVQIGPGLGRATGAALIGPLSRLSIALPVLPALIGAGLSLRRLARPDGHHPDGIAVLASPRCHAPRPAALLVPFLVQAAIGAGQLGLGPRLALTRPPDEAATMAGLCLASGYLALLLVHARLTAAGVAMRPAAALLAAALALPAFLVAPLALIVATALAAGASGLLIARHLARIITARPESARHSAAWQGSALLAGLGSGAGAGALVLPLSPAAPFLLGAALSLVILLICQRFT